MSYAPCCVRSHFGKKRHPPPSGGLPSKAEGPASEGLPHREMILRMLLAAWGTATGNVGARANAGPAVLPLGVRGGERSQQRLGPLASLRSARSQRALGSLLKSRLWSFGNSVRQHKAHPTRGSRMMDATKRVAQRGDGCVCRHFRSAQDKGRPTTADDRRSESAPYHCAGPSIQVGPGATLVPRLQSTHCKYSLNTRSNLFRQSADEASTLPLNSWPCSDMRSTMNKAT